MKYKTKLKKTPGQLRSEIWELEHAQKELKIKPYEILKEKHEERKARKKEEKYLKKLEKRRQKKYEQELEFLKKKQSLKS